MTEAEPATDALRDRWRAGEWMIGAHGTSTDPDSEDFSLLYWISMLDARIEAEVRARKAAEERVGELEEFARTIRSGMRFVSMEETISELRGRIGRALDAWDRDNHSAVGPILAQPSSEEAEAEPATLDLGCKSHRDGPHKDCPACWHKLYSLFDAEVRAHKAAEERQGKLAESRAEMVAQRNAADKTIAELRAELASRQGGNATAWSELHRENAELRADIAANDRLESQEIAELRGRLEAAERLGVWAVVYSNYHPSEVYNIYATEAQAREKAEWLNKRDSTHAWEAQRWKIISEEADDAE